MTTATKILDAADTGGNGIVKPLRAIEPKRDPREEWLARTPEPLDRRAELPPFPSEMLPQWAGDFVEALAEATQTPTDMAGTFVLGAISAAVGGRLRVQVNAGHVEGTNLYAGIVAEPGTRKSPVHSACTQPIAEVERELRAEAHPAIVRATTRKAIAVGRAKKAATDAENAKGLDASRLAIAAEEAAHEADSIEVPRDPLLLIGDATPERLVELLGEHEGRLAIIADEDPIFGQLRGRYSKAPLLDPLLSAYSGATIRRHRKDRVDVVVEQPALTIVVAIQPRVLEGIPADHEIRTRGLLDRFAIVVPKNLIGFRNMDPPPVPEALADEYRTHLRALVLESYRGKARTVRLSAEGRAELVAWLKVLEKKKRPAGAYASIVGWASKAEGLASRIAGILHAGDGNGTAEIDAETVERATLIVDYLAAHALVAADAMGADAALNDARRLLAWARDRGEPFTERDAKRNLTSVTDGDRDRAVRYLETTGHLFAGLAAPGAKGGRPAKRWEVHPKSEVSSVLAVSGEEGTGREKEREKAFRYRSTEHCQNRQNPPSTTSGNGGLS